MKSASKIETPADAGAAPVTRPGGFGPLPECVELPDPSTPLDARCIPAHGAVYAFLDSERQLIQLLSAQNLRRAAALRLSRPVEGPASRRAELRSIARFLCWKPTWSAFESALEFLRAARELMPQTYAEQLAFGPVWFAHVDPTERLPRWLPRQTAFDTGGVSIGPFDRRRRCADFIADLEDVFDLCRYFHILEQAPDGVACAYFDMGKCPAPCNGSISLDQYRGMMHASLAFARGACDQRLAELQHRMHAAAQSLRFEEAAAVRQTLERATKCQARAGRLCGEADDFVYLVVQRGPKRSLVRPFFVNRGAIEVGDDVRLDAVEQKLPGWAERLLAIGGSPALDAKLRSEHVWLVCHFLNKSEAAAGAFLHFSNLRDRAAAKARIRARFTPEPRRRSGARA